MFFEMRFDLGTLDSGERSLPFGLLVSSSGQLDLVLQWATSLASCLGFLFNDTRLTLYRLYVNIGKKD